MKQGVYATLLEFLATMDNVILVSLLQIQRKQQMALRLKFILEVFFLLINRINEKHIF